MAGVKLHPGGTENNSSAIYGGSSYAVEIYGGVGTVTNSGLISSGDWAVILLENGGSVNNESGGTIRTTSTVNGGIYIEGGTAAVTNAGAIDAGVWLKSSGTVLNQTGGTIASTVTSGYGVGLQAGGSVTNYGEITGSKDGVELDNGGAITNEAQATIGGGDVGVMLGFPLPYPAGNPNSGGGSLTNDAGAAISGHIGVAAGGSAAAVINAGTITGTTAGAIAYHGYTVKLGDGVDMAAGGAVTNQSTGNITGARYGIYITGGGSVTNAGAVSGVDGSVVFAGQGANTLTLQTGSTLTGAAVGSVFGDATNALVLQGTGTANNNFVNFDTLDVQSGASWTLGGISSIGATLVDGGDLKVTGALASEFTIENGGVLDFAGAFDGRARFIGAGALQVGGDAAGTATGFGQNDVIDFENVGFTSGDSISVAASGANATIEVVNASDQVVASFVTGAGYTASDFSLQSINGGSGLSVTGGETVVDVAQFLANQTALDANPNGFLVEDSATNVASALPQLGADAHAIGITLTDIPSPIVTLSPSQIESDRAALDKVSEPYSIAVVDTTANDSLDMQTLAAPSQVVSVTIANSGTVVNETGLSITATGGYHSAITLSQGGTVDNAGDLSATRGLHDAGVAAFGAAHVTNSGTILATGNFVAGISLYASGTATNSGSIETSGTDNSSIYLEKLGTVDNTGSISETGTYTSGVYLRAGGVVNNYAGGAISGDAGVQSAGGVTLSNAGQISASWSGVYLGQNSTVTNSGSITSSGANGAVLKSGTVTNETGGIITGAQNGVYISVGYGVVDNAGYIDSDAKYYNGVDVQSGVVTNEVGGTIRTVGDEMAAVSVHGIGKVVNDGLISASGHDSAGVNLWNGGTVTNAGTISTSGDLVADVILWAGGAFTNSGTATTTATNTNSVYLANGGTVSNLSGGTISGFENGVHANNGASNIVNAGAITATGTGTANFYHGILLWDAAGSRVNNELGGSITASGYKGCGIYMNLYGVVTNAGTISDSGNNTSGLALAGGGVVTNSGLIDDSGAGGNGAGGSGFGDAVSFGDGGTLTNAAGGVIQGARDGVYVVGASGSVTNAGSISGARGSVVFAGAGANTLTLQPGSTLTGAAVGNAAPGTTNALILQGTGTADNVFTNFTTLDAQAGANWTLGADENFGSASVEGSLTIDANVVAPFSIDGGTLDFAVASNDAVTFSGAGTLDVGANFTGTITGFNADDALDFQGDVTSATWAGDVLTLKDGATSVATLNFSGAYGGDTFVATSLGGGVTEIQEAPCYRRGARLLAARGLVAVEDLQVGERLVTASGGSRPIVWIGHRALNCRRHANPRAVWPVRVATGAFGDHRPACDLWLSPGHSVAVNGVLIPIIHLVNGRSVVQVEVDEVEYFHVELDAHDVVLAEALPAESYLDAGNRSDFANGGAFVTAHPEFAAKACDETCLPLVHEGPRVAEARALLLARLAEQGVELTTDAGAYIYADGRRIAPMRLGSRRLGFALPKGCERIDLRSRTFTPAHAELANGDDRRLGLCVGRLQIDGEELALDDAALDDAGWHEAERSDGRIVRRWTRGAARMPAGARLLVVDLAGDGYYWRQPPLRLVARVE